MTFDATGSRRRTNWTPWLAGVAAVLALALLAWAVLGPRAGGDDRESSVLRPRRAATPNAVEAVALAPALDPGPAGVLGGAGSAVLDGGAQPTSAVPGEPVTRRTNRTRRMRPRREPSQSAQPSYRTIGPGGSDAPSPAPEAPPPGA